MGYKFSVNESVRRINTHEMGVVIQLTSLREVVDPNFELDDEEKVDNDPWYVVRWDVSKLDENMDEYHLMAVFNKN